MDAATTRSAGFATDSHSPVAITSIFLPNYAVFDEQRYFTPGSDPLVIDLKGSRIGVIICEDAWEPHAGTAGQVSRALNCCWWPMPHLTVMTSSKPAWKCLPPGMGYRTAHGRIATWSVARTSWYSMAAAC